MFDGVPSDQFHQFVAAAAAAAASSTTSQLQPPPPSLSFPLHVSSSTFPSFDLYPSGSGGGGGGGAAAAHQPLQVPHLLHPLHHNSSAPHKDDQGKEENALVSINLEPQRERSMLDLINPGPMMKKLAEQGFKRSAEKCKEKFEQESRYFNTTMNYSKNYRFFSELEELYHGESPHQQDVAEKNQKVVEKPNEEDRSLEEDSRNETVVGNPCLETEKVEDKSKGKKRKRHTQNKSFEMFKGFCEAVVSKMMAQQEEMHNKLLEDMVKRDEEKTAREEAWKKQEMDRINKEIEIREHEQAIAGELSKVPSRSNPPTSPSSILPQNPNPTSHLSPQNKQLEAPTSSRKVIVPHQNPCSLTTPTNPNAPIDEAQPSQNPTSMVLESQNPNSLNTQKSPSAPTSFPSITDHRDQELGKRWPRDEVLALINLRCSLNVEDKEGAKGPLWERISQGMLALGYKRSAKRCKEKWENINKYFRKTKDVSKKRSLDSRTCPYFHQLSTLYSQGTLVVPSSEAPAPENCLNSSENHSALPENQVGGSSSNTNMHAADEGEENAAQLPAYDFKF
ncbi:Trihelix transcription factor GTL2 [Vitis vinifera]|uniref:Trihelix transcription factor GTL2 n=1 Tax=Vitis vinifera TaxID=29760 RepID=A0A438BQA0_VITVI|nr:Trihelix transcription factor GTL2 [Vitis vinifera]